MIPVILVHGTYAQPRSGQRQWYEPGSDFCKALDAALVARNISAQCWAQGDLKATTFSWSGENDWISRREGAQKLQQLIQSLDGRCHIVAHSHGGNVALEALEMDSGAFHGSLTLLGTPLMIRKARSWHFAAVFYVVLALILGFGAISLSRREVLWTIAAGVVLGGLTLLAWYCAFLWAILVDQFQSPLGSTPDPLYINSDQDEAYRLLRAVAETRDPLKSNKQERINVRKRISASLAACGQR